MGLDPSSATAHCVFLVRDVPSQLSQMAKAWGPGKGRNLGGLKTELLEISVVATCWGNISDGCEASSLNYSKINRDYLKHFFLLGF